MEGGFLYSVIKRKISRAVPAQGRVPHRSDLPGWPQIPPLEMYSFVLESPIIKPFPATVALVCLWHLAMEIVERTQTFSSDLPDLGL